jgi:phosphate starvation-inducible protein PhoH
MSRKRNRNRRGLEQEIEILQYALDHERVENGKTACRQKKTWNAKDLRNLHPMTNPQHDMIYHFVQGEHLCAYGSAGTGKSLIALFLGMQEVLNPDSPISHIKIVRSTVPSRDQGFLPGKKEEKEMVYELPYHDIMTFLFGRKSSYEDLKKAEKLEFVSTSHIRGLTWDDCVVIVDEGQNMTFEEINSVVTRLGRNSRLIFLGDHPQCDLTKKHEISGMEKFVRIANSMDEFMMIRFTKNDIVRSKFVKSWIEAVEDDI